MQKKKTAYVSPDIAGILSLFDPALDFLPLNVAEVERHIHLSPTASYFQFQLMNIYDTASRQN